MYGLVNKAIEQMVYAEHGEEIWETIKERASLDIETFISMDIYADDVTYKLIQAASEVIGKPVETLLEDLGSYWPNFTSHEGYKHLLDMAGSSLQEFLENLDVLHACLVESFPRIRPPTFTYQQISPTVFDLHYYSLRRGLAPMVTGMVKTLAMRFRDKIEVTHAQRRDDGHDHDVFRIHVLTDGSTLEPRTADGAND